MDLTAWVTMGTVRVRHQQEAAAFHEAAAARAEADARARATQALVDAKEAARQAH
jgi:hypothetical protein